MIRESGMPGKKRDLWSRKKQGRIIYKPQSHAQVRPEETKTRLADAWVSHVDSVGSVEPETIAVKEVKIQLYQAGSGWRGKKTKTDTNLSNDDPVAYWVKGGNPNKEERRKRKESALNKNYSSTLIKMLKTVKGATKHGGSRRRDKGGGEEMKKVAVVSAIKKTSRRGATSREWSRERGAGLSQRGLLIRSRTRLPSSRNNLGNNADSKPQTGAKRIARNGVAGYRERGGPGSPPEGWG